tara:strand:+ start:289 stop:2568 length:2280 start_codon:yes stop_codon:yes gene_type:complete
MATIEELSAALIKADAAGNAADAKSFADEIRRVRQTSAPAVSEIPKDRKITDVDRDLLAGVVRGAGSIGATILAPFDALARARGTELPYFPGRLDDRRQQMTQALATMGADPESTAFALGQTGTEIAGTLPIGGLLGKGVTAVAPRLAPLATAIETGGFRTGLAPGLKSVAARAAGGAVAGGASAAAVNPEDATSGAIIGAVLPTFGAALVKQGAKFSGWLYDAMKGKLGEVKAGEIARRVAGGDLAAIRAANTAAQQGLSSGQAAAGIDNATYAALDDLARKQNPASYYSRQATDQADAATNELARLAGGTTATESRAVRETSKNALNAITTPMREIELGAAGEAGRITPGLESKVAKFEQGATAKVEDVRRFTAAADRASEWAKTWTPTTTRDSGRSLLRRYAKDHPQFQYTYPSQLAVRADQVATDAAESSLRFGEVARDAKSALASLEANGLRPLKTESLVSTLQSKLTNPDIGTNRDAAGAITRVSQMLQDWTNKYGIITPEALYAIRKNGVAGAIADLNPGANEDQRRQFAQSVMRYVRPLFDDAIEQAGGTGWGAYLKTFERGMHGIEEKQLADVARNLYKSGDKAGFVALVTGNNPKLVEDIFGPGKYDFSKEMGKAAVQFEQIAANTARDTKLAEQATKGGEALFNIIQDATPKFNFPPSLSTKIAIARQGLREFEGKVNKATLAALTEGMKSGASANAMLDMLPAKERVKVLRIMSNSPTWNPQLTAAARQGMVNQLAPEESQNRLAAQ